MLGPEPVNAAIHSTGYWAIWLLLASLVVSPLRALAWSPNLAVLRRMVGNAAFVYVALHLVLYSMDQQWRLLTIVSEIVKRFYLTIGFVALLGLAALFVTSTDGWMRTLGRAWKRLHRLAYPIAGLGLVHYILQSKLDVSQALLAMGVFTWLMLWRVLPGGLDRQLLPLLGISVLAAGLTLACEYLWYRFGTRSDAIRVVLGELDVSFGLRPAGQVLLLGLVASVAAELRRRALTRFGRMEVFTMAVFAACAFVGDGAALFAGWQPDDPAPADLPWWMVVGLCAAVCAVLGWRRWKAEHRQRQLVDAAMAAFIVFQSTYDGPIIRRLQAIGLLAAMALVTGAVIARRSRGHAQASR